MTSCRDCTCTDPRLVVRELEEKIEEKTCELDEIRELEGVDEIWELEGATEKDVVHRVAWKNSR